MIPRTKNGLPRLLCISAMQKHIRRAEERPAMEMAVEVSGTDKAGFTMVCNRLEIISHEDIGLANPQAVVFVASAMEQARRFYDVDKPGKARMMIANAIMILCRSAKSREGDHFNIAVGFASDLEGNVPKFADHTLDMHSQEGRKLGRDIEHFIQEGTKLVPQPKADQYKAEAERLMRKKHGRTAVNSKTLFDEE